MTPNELYVERFIFLGDWLWKESSAGKVQLVLFRSYFSVGQLEVVEVSKKAQLTPFFLHGKEYE